MPLVWLVVASPLCLYHGLLCLLSAGCCVTSLSEPWPPVPLVQLVVASPHCLHHGLLCLLSGWLLCHLVVCIAALTSTAALLSSVSLPVVCIVAHCLGCGIIICERRCCLRCRPSSLSRFCHLHWHLHHCLHHCLRRHGLVPSMYALMSIFFCSNSIAQLWAANQCPPRNFLQAMGLIAKPNCVVYNARPETTRSTL